MCDTIKDRVIGLCNDHVPTIHTGGRKWKSNYSHDKEVLDLIRENARCHRFWVARQHGIEGWSASQSYNQASNRVRKRTRQLRKQHELNIANQSPSNPKVFWRFARERLKTRIGVAPLLYNPNHSATTTFLDKCVEAVSRGNVTDVVYLDFQKAFDNVSHKRLMVTLKHMAYVGSS